MARVASLFVIALVVAATMLPAQAQSVDEIIKKAVAEAEKEILKAQQQAAQAVSSSSSASSGSSASSSASAWLGGVSKSVCRTMSSTSSNSCANGKCCSVKQTVRACNGYLYGQANVNGKTSTCCVVLLDTKNKNRPGLFCTSPYVKGVNYQLASTNKVKMIPTCTSVNGNTAGSLTCAVQFAKLPLGWVPPPQATSWSKAFRFESSAVTPCKGPYRGMVQVTVKTGPTPLVQAKCV